MARNRGRFGRPGPRLKRSNTWTGIPGVTIVTLGAGTATTFWVVDPTQRAAFDEFTVVRSMFLIQARLPTGTAAGGTLAYGLIVASGDPDVTTVPTEFPEPNQDVDADWQLWNALPFPAGVAAGALFDPEDSLAIWSRGQRKLEKGEGFLAVLQNTTAESVALAFHVRVFAKI